MEPSCLWIRCWICSVRKPGKLPSETISYSYDFSEYSSDTLQIHKDAIKPGQRVAIVDDLLATGGTMEAAAKLIEQLGGEVVSMQFLIELEDLKGRREIISIRSKFFNKVLYF